MSEQVTPRGRDVRRMKKPWSCRDVLFECSNGYRIERCPPEDWPLESKFMGHCLGGNHPRMVPSKPTRRAFSLRRPDGTPHVTITFGVSAYGDFEINGERVRLSQVRGRCNGLAKPQYRELIMEWLRSLGMEDFAGTELTQLDDSYYGMDDDDQYHEEGLLNDDTYNNHRRRQRERNAPTPAL